MPRFSLCDLISAGLSRRSEVAKMGNVRTRRDFDSLGPRLGLRYPRGFAVHVARPTRFIETHSPPGSLAPTLVTLPSMSLIPSAPFFS
jgi:hypothetical protein